MKTSIGDLGAGRVARVASTAPPAAAPRAPAQPATAPRLPADRGPEPEGPSSAQPAPVPLLKAEAVSYAVGKHTLVDQVSFHLVPGEYWGIVGPNGAGKTTLLRLLCGFLKPSSGAVHVAGQRVDSLQPNQLARHLALVPQDSGSELDFTALEVVLMGRFVHNSRWRESPADRQIALEALQAAGARHLADRTFRTLSGGERQRVVLARALAQEPQILLLDEPTANLDPRFQLAAMETVRQAVDANGMAALAALHDLTLAARYCDKLLLLHQGRVVAAGPPETVLQPVILAEVYGVTVTVERHPRLGHLVVLADSLLPAPSW
ncbi:MAG TPA: heme ABC transporter ATP-binding protein [Sphingobacteriaceae bacterium]|nr:heme ABC transporter ATP-binding protein [Sphingobacteriaceae bacterium]